MHKDKDPRKQQRNNLNGRVCVLRTNATMEVLVWLSRINASSLLCMLLAATTFPHAVSVNVAEADLPYLEHPHVDSCSWTGGSCEWDYNMQPMTAVFENNRKEVFYAYVEPDVSTFYNQSEGQLQVVRPDFTGMFVKFVNMGPRTVRIMWYVEGRADDSIGAFIHTFDG
jgi:hypothetical protein